MLDRNTIGIHNDNELIYTAQRLIMKLAIRSGILPSSLVITGVSQVETVAASGGGFADIYRAYYMGGQVAMKKFRAFETNDRQALHRVCTITLSLRISSPADACEQMLCKEALLWKDLTHPHVLPFLGLDAEAFPGFICMVSPWMQHGTVLAFVHRTMASAKETTRLVRPCAFRSIQQLKSSL
jgi:hypothetical protein